MQISSDKKVYIFDLIKLHEDVPTVLDECFARMLHSPSILKLGKFNFHGYNYLDYGNVIIGF